VARKELRPEQVKLAKELLVELGFDMEADRKPRKPFTVTPRMLRERDRLRRCHPDWRERQARNEWPPRWKNKYKRITSHVYLQIVKLLLEITGEGRRRGRPLQSEDEWEKSQDLKLQTIETCLVYYDEHPKASPGEVYDALGKKLGPNRHTPLSRSAIRKRMGAAPEDINKQNWQTLVPAFDRRPWSLRKAIKEVVKADRKAG
jgi:hypothetical protein